MLFSALYFHVLTSYFARVIDIKTSYSVFNLYCMAGSSSSRYSLTITMHIRCKNCEVPRLLILISRRCLTCYFRTPRCDTVSNSERTRFESRHTYRLSWLKNFVISFNLSSEMQVQDLKYEMTAFHAHKVSSVIIVRSLDAVTYHCDILVKWITKNKWDFSFSRRRVRN
jgi:hypothetical protein